MPATYFIGLLIFVVVIPSNAWVYQCKAYPTTKKCDHFTFSQLWPPTFCKIEKCSIPTGVNTWTIHGLWPDAPNYYLSFCYPKQVFDPNSITDITDKLQLVWPSLKYNEENMYFWQNEWCKHGSCALNCTTETDSERNYFNKTVDLNKKFSIDKALSENGIVPGKSYNLTTITDALHDAFNATSIVCCSVVGGQNYLHEIHLCMTTDFTLKDCDVSMTGCKKYEPISYPSFKSSFISELSLELP